MFGHGRDNAGILIEVQPEVQGTIDTEDSASLNQIRNRLL